MLAVLGGAAVLGAAAGRADTIAMVSTGLEVSAYVNRTIDWSGSGYDQLQVIVAGLNGPAGGSAIDIIEGTWSINGGAACNMVSDAAARGWWGNYTTSAMAAAGYPQTVVGNGQSPAPLSFVNLDSNVANYTGWGRTGAGQAFSSFDGSWYTAAAANEISDGVATAVTTMATFYVPTGLPAQVSYSGALSFTYGGGVVEAGSLQTTIPGDANGDGRVDINDLTIVLSNYGRTAGASWSTGDFNGDGRVDINDLTIVLSSYGATVGSSAGATAPAPEPSALVLLLAGAACLGALARCGWPKSKLPASS